MAFVTSFTAYDAMVSEESKQVGQQVDGKYVNGCSDHKGSARPKRKGKQKKVPQRGLGVAQLERMRMEEQKKEVGSSSSSLMVPVARGVTVPTSNSNYDIPVPSFNFCPVLPDSAVPPTWEFTPQVVSVDSSEPAFGFGFPFSGDLPVLVGSSRAAVDQKPLPYQQGREKVPTMVGMVDVCVNIFIVVLFLVLSIAVCRLINVFDGFCCVGECFIYKLVFFWS